MAKKRKIPFEITNMVAAGDLGLHLDLFHLAMNLPEIEYEPEQFPGAILKFDEPKASFLIFKNGKCVCVGCKDEETIDKALRKLKRKLKPYAQKILTKKAPTFEITNMVAAGDLKKDIDLFLLALELPDVEYEPEQFPGAILKFDNPKASVLLFKNGKVICAGAQNEDEIEKTLMKTKKIVDEHVKRHKKRE
jgi:transcription initiation factor TFIID TATA-box-binding protein